MKKLHGVRLAHHKNTENCASVPLPVSYTHLRAHET